MFLNNEQNEQIQELIRNLERRTGVEFIAAVVGKCDTYPEIPWKAFAMASALGALLSMVHVVFRPEWHSVWNTWFHLGWVLAAGATAALLTLFWPAFARLFLDGTRAEAETRQYAQGIFLERELFRTGHRQAVLLVVGLFEHQVVIMPDHGVQARLQKETLASVISRMKPHLRQGDPYQALIEGIAQLETALIAAGFKASAGARNQISDVVIQQKGDAS